LGLRGWDNRGGMTIITNNDGDQALRLNSGSRISQTFAPYDRFIGLTPSEQITFCGNFDLLSGPARITLLLDQSEMATIDINKTANRCVSFDAQPFKKLEIKFSITSDNEIQIDDLRLYSYVHTLDMYDENGQPGPTRDLIVRMNNDWLVD